MNAHHSQIAADFAPYRVITKIFGSLLGPEYLVAAGDKYYRCGGPTISQLKRGIPIAELDLLEVGPDGDPVEYEADDRACSAADIAYQRKREL